MSNQLHTKVPNQRTPVRKRVPLAGKPDMSTGFTSVPDGFLVGDLHIVVDVPKLIAAIGHKALCSKKHVSKLQDGAVIVRALNVRHEGGAS